MDIGVLITGVGSGSTGEQVYKALRHGRRPYRIVVANVHPDNTVVAGGAPRARLPPADHDEYLEALAAVTNASSSSFIVPGSDPELWRIASRRRELAALTEAIPLVNGQATIATCRDKEATALAIQRAGCSAPVTLDCSTVEAAKGAVEANTLRYPVVIKPKHGGGGSANVYLAQDATELLFFAQYVLAQGVPLLIQEYVGDTTNEFTVGVLHYPNGALAGSFALRRDLTTLLSSRLRIPNRTGRADLGPWLAISSGFSQGTTDDFPDVRAAAEAVASAVDSTGPLNVQGRLVGSRFYVFEVNPRFSGTEAMRAMAGWNAPEALIDWHLGVPTALSDYRPQARTFIRSLAEYAIPDGDLREPSSTPL